MKCCQTQNAASLVGTTARTVLIAAAVGVVGVIIGTAATSARQPHGGDHGHHGGAAGAAGHVGGVREHYAMVQGPNGPAAAKDAMLRMAAHQFLLGEAAADPELRKLAATPEMRKAIEEVRATLKDHAKLDAAKAELLKDHDQMLSIVAHALLMQDAEATRLLKDAEAGKANH